MASNRSVPEFAGHRQEREGGDAWALFRLEGEEVFELAHELLHILELAID